MADTPNFGFHRKPRFSINHVADYISTDNAGQREAVIRAAKFPRKTQVVPYTISRRIVRPFLTTNKGDPSSLDDDLTRLNTRLRNEPEGWMQDEIRRNIAAIEAFKKVFTKKRLGRFRFVTGTVDMTMTVEKVRINAHLDSMITETNAEGVVNIGACALFFARTNRKKIEERQKTVAALIHWEMQEAGGGNIEPLERLCVAFDVFGATITAAPKAKDRLRANIKSSCREAAAQWDGVEPPPGYDGPDWR